MERGTDSARQAAQIDACVLVRWAGGVAAPAHPGNYPRVALPPAIHGGRTRFAAFVHPGTAQRRNPCRLCRHTAGFALLIAPTWAVWHCFRQVAKNPGTSGTSRALDCGDQHFWIVTLFGRRFVPVRTRLFSKLANSLQVLMDYWCF